MSIYAISDLHISTNTNKPMDIFGGKWDNYIEKIRADWTEKVNDGDFVLISGDISWAMELDEALVDMARFSDLKGEKILIRGNHDFWWKSITKMREQLPKGIYALQNDSLKFGNVVFCGSRAWSVPGSPDFTKNDEKLYLREAERLRMSLTSAAKLREEGDKLVVMVHYPPFNVRRDSTLYTDLFKEFKADAVIYGHLHGKDAKAEKIVIKDGIKYYLTSCDLVDNTLVKIEV